MRGVVGALLLTSGCLDNLDVALPPESGIDLPGESWGDGSTLGNDDSSFDGPLDGDANTSGNSSNTSGTPCDGDECPSESICGDSIVSANEACDDGDAMPGDGCSGLCLVEPNFRCPIPGEACQSTVICGDGQVSGAEACDDRNAVAGDGCSSTCLVEPGYACSQPGMPCTVGGTTAQCGNSAVEFPETCDDGNAQSGDGCSEVCERSAGYSCPTPGDSCVADEFCGNGLLATSGEACDDGNTISGDGCDGLCRIESFHECPIPGEACVSRIVCGDFVVIGDEACDDGRRCTDGSNCTNDASACIGIGDDSCAPRAGDGCSATCGTVEAGYRCPTAAGVGGACVAIPDPACGDGRLDYGEYCDDGNLDPSDGCTDSCTVTPGYACPEVGELCSRIAYCGDGTRNAREQCDDGSVCEDGTTDCTTDASACDGVGDGACAPRGGDGCSLTCVLEVGFTCPPNGGACVSNIACGDGLVGGSETCDLGGVCEDGVTICTEDPSLCAGIGDGACLHHDHPGCTECAIAPGWSCSRGGSCRATACGDGILAGLEFCDDGRHCTDGSACAQADDCGFGECRARAGDGCNEGCTLEPGFRCDAPGEACEPTHCGDGLVEGSEQCDDRNNDVGDGCTPFCQAEPLCDLGPCSSPCGDAIRFSDEDCDDGNRRDGDGCSSACEVEQGFLCSEPTDLPGTITVPIVVRDFHGDDNADPEDEHVDFETDSDAGEVMGRDTAIVRRGGTACHFDDRDDDDPSNDAIRGGDLGCAGETYDMKDDGDSVLATLSMAGKPVFFDVDCNRTDPPSFANGWSKCTRTVTDADSFHQWFTDRPADVDAPAWNSHPTTVDGLTLVNGRFADDGTFTAGGDAFSFDSRSMSIADPDPEDAEEGFYPIDALDLTGTACNGGSEHNFHLTSEVHYWFEYDASVSPTLTFSGDDDVWVYVNGFRALDMGGIHGRQQGSFDIDATNAERWGLRNGNIYEIAVFQAERNVCASNYWLTLDGFVPRTSVCTSDCGDGIVASIEECDDGTNDGSYGTCNPDCTLTAYCGDGQIDADGGEICDAGADFLVYGGTDVTCGPDCQYAPYCGDGRIDGAFGESCDDGVNDGSYGTCNPDCSLADYCGDGATTAAEACDDGIDNGTPGSECRTDCTFQCGDGDLDAGEECDAGVDNGPDYGQCRTDCTRAPYCGDGIRQSEFEACDDGLNDGSYGTCAPSCTLGPRCGDEVLQTAAGERCDNGDANVVSSYGDETGCTIRCLPTPYCGDRAVSDGETCDDGVNSGLPGSCLGDCSDFIPLATCGNGTPDNGEHCDDGLGLNGNGSASSDCDANCRQKCGNGAIDPGETCDDGVNDGRYGACQTDCSFAGFCGDRTISGPEECDLGTDNDANPYGRDACTIGCRAAPYCGDGRTQTVFGEQCDGQPNCTTGCHIFML